ncbi:MAG: bifunctional metallophosphatase/5'-nucleotidase [Lachnospiraceae bacterium]|nr:bifunctional metallophosphatase/5'-nucleotidase [Lachnospiraceae bacterium]
MKKLTLLHSNDMHGDFLAEQIDEALVGGVSMLSGYVNKVRREEENVIYAIAGDMFRGSIIDSEYHGLSTIQIMNMLAPDIVTLGNHEVDYGISHLLFLEKCAKFPIINANMYIKTNHERLFSPCRILEVDGMKILFIGILTEMVLNECRKDGLIGTIINVEDAAREVGKICNSYNSIDIDLTVLLTHIGFEEDQKLAALLDPAWGVDLIIGGHSHTFMDQPEVVNGIPIVQAGTGTDQIGRFDIMIDTDNNCIDSYTWSSVPINSENCPRDIPLETIINDYKNTTDEKYGQILTGFVRELTHPSRYMETELGDLFADIMAEALGTDIFLLASGSIRTKVLGPIVTKGGFLETFPFDDQANLTYWTGAQLKHGIMRMLRDETFFGDHTEFYQVSSALSIEYDMVTHSFLKFDYNGAPIEDDKVYTVGLQEYHLKNLKDSFDLELEEIEKNHKHRALATSCVDVLEEMLRSKQHLNSKVQGRLVLHLTDEAKQALIESGI